MILLGFRRTTGLLGSTWLAMVAIVLVALGGRLFPAETQDAFGGNRLSDPLGYWNSLGLWSAMGLALSMVLAARARSMAMRALAAGGWFLALPPCT